VRPELNVAAALLLAWSLARARPPQRAALARRRGPRLSAAGGGLLRGARRLLRIPAADPVLREDRARTAVSRDDDAIAFGQALLATSALFAVIPTALAPAAVAPAWLAVGAVVAVGVLPIP